MTDQDNLRDRIAGVVESASFQWDTDFNAWQLGRPNSADPGPKSPRIAQAIIDEFELTIEPHCEECEHKVIEGWWGKQ